MNANSVSDGQPVPLSKISLAVTYGQHRVSSMNIVITIIMKITSNIELNYFKHRTPIKNDLRTIPGTLQNSKKRRI